MPNGCFEFFLWGEPHAYFVANYAVALTLKESSDARKNRYWSVAGRGCYRPVRNHQPRRGYPDVFSLELADARYFRNQDHYVLAGMGYQFPVRHPVQVQFFIVQQ